MDRKIKINNLRFNNIIIMGLIVLLVFGIFSNLAYADDQGNIIDNISLTKTSVETKDDRFGLKGKWSIKLDGSAKAGDTFTLYLPEDFDLRLLRGKLPLKGSDGNLYGSGRIDKENKKIDFIFTDEVEKRENIWGEFQMEGLLLDVKDPNPEGGIENKDYTIKDQNGNEFKNTLEINNDLYGEVDTGVNSNGEQKVHRDNNFDKVGQIHTGLGDTMYWYVYVNAKEQEERVPGNMFVEDVLGSGHSIDMKNFSITLTDEANNNASGLVLKMGTEEFDKYIEDFKWINGNKGYSFNFKSDADGEPKALRVYYHTEIDEDAPYDQTIFTNKYNLNHSSDQKVGLPKEVDFGSMLGTGYGIPNAKGDFKLFKVDENGEVIRQKGIEFRFEVIPEESTSENRHFEQRTVTTDENGIAIVEDIYSGIYTLTEIVPPKGYLIDFDPKKIVLNFGGLIDERKELERKNEDLKNEVILIEEEENSIEVMKDEIEQYKKKMIEEDYNASYYQGLINSKEYEINNKNINIDYKKNELDKIKKDISSSEKKINRLLSQGIEFKFKNEAIKNTSLSSKKRWEIEGEYENKEDLKAEVYLIRKTIKYDEEDNFEVIEEVLEETTTEINFSEEDTELVWENLPMTDEYGNEHSYFIKEKENDSYEIFYLDENNELVLVNKIKGEEPKEPEVIEPEEPKEPEVIEPEEPKEPEVIEPEEPKEPEVIEPEEPKEPEVIEPEEPKEPEVIEPEEPKEPEVIEPEEPKEPEVIEPEEPKEPEVIEPEEPKEPEVIEPEEPKEPEVIEPEEPKEPEVIEPEEPKEPEVIEPEEPKEPEVIEPEEPKEPEVIEPEEPKEPEVIEPEEPKEPEVIEPEEPKEPEVIEPEENGKIEIEEQIKGANYQKEDYFNLDINELVEAKDLKVIDDKKSKLIEATDLDQLPQTGESKIKIQYIIGSILILLGFAMKKTVK